MENTTSLELGTLHTPLMLKRIFIISNLACIIAVLLKIQAEAFITPLVVLKTIISVYAV